MFRYVLVSLIPSKTFYPESMLDFCQRVFQHLLRYHVGFSSSISYMVDHIDWFLYIQPPLHLCDKVYLIIHGGWSFWCALEFGLWNWAFLHSWGKMVYNSLFLLNFIWFGYPGNCGLIKLFGIVPSVPMLWNNLRRNDISSSMEVWYKFVLKFSGHRLSCLFVCLFVRF